MRACAAIILLLPLFIFLASGQSCHELLAYKICYNLSMQHEARSVSLPSSEITVSGKNGIQKIILQKGKINIICDGKERAWIMIQEFYKPDINDQNDQTAMLGTLKREQSSQNPTFSSWVQNGYKGHKAVSKKVNEPLTASIVIFWKGDGDKKTRCIIYSELSARYTTELLDSIRIGARPT